MKAFLPSFVALIVCVALLIVMTSCGGGTTGTGTGSGSVPYIEGSIRQTDGSAISGARITVLQTGTRTSSDTDGNFKISTLGTPQTLALRVATNSFQEDLSVTKPPALENQALQLSIKIDTKRRKLTVKRLDVIAKIDGACDYAFENNRTIRQSNRLETGTVCRIEVKVSGDGRYLEGIPFIFQRSSCVLENWNTIAAGETGRGASSGVGTLDFTYRNVERDCRYRVIVPYGVPGLDQLVFNIDTYRKQEFDQNKRLSR